MKSNVRIRVLLAATLALAAAGCTAKASNEAKRAAAQATTPPAPTVNLVAAREVMSARTEEVTGTLNPTKSLPLGFEVGGRLAIVHVKKGDQVKAGQVLAELDTEIADAQVKQARAALAAARAGYGMASDLAERNGRLRAEGSVSEVQNRSAATTSRQAQAQLLGAKAALAQAEAARRKHALVAPIGGTLIMAPEQPGATVGPGMPLFVIEQLDTLLFQTTVSEESRADLAVGTKVAVKSVAGSAATDEATIRTIIPSADPSTRRVPVDIVVPNEDGRFIAHTLARATLTLGEPAPAVALPATAIDAAGGDHVFVQDGGKARRVNVAVLQRSDAEVIVRPAEPLKQVIDRPNAGITDGMNVAVK